MAADERGEVSTDTFSGQVGTFDSVRSAGQFSSRLGWRAGEYVARGGHVNLSKFVPNRFMSATPRDATRYHAHTTPPHWRLPRLFYLSPLSLSLLSSHVEPLSRDPSKVSSPSLKLYNPMGRETEPRAKNPCQWSLLTGVVKHSVYIQRNVAPYFYILLHLFFKFYVIGFTEMSLFS